MVAPVTMMVPLLFTSVGVSWNAVTDDTVALLSASAIVCALMLTSGVLPPSPPLATFCTKLTLLRVRLAPLLTKNTPPRPAPPPLPVPPCVTKLVKMALLVTVGAA